MKKHNHESAELTWMTVVGIIGCVVASYVNRERLSLMIFLTIVMGLMAFIARFRRARDVRTLKGKGRRKASKPKTEQ